MIVDVDMKTKERVHAHDVKCPCSGDPSIASRIAADIEERIGSSLQSRPAIADTQR